MGFIDFLSSLFSPRKARPITEQRTAFQRAVERILAARRKANANRPGYKRYCTNPKKIAFRLRHVAGR